MATFSCPEPNILALEGEIDLHDAPALKEQFARMQEGKPERLFIDLSSVRYIDSSGLAVFIGVMQSVAAYGGKLGLYGIQENVQTVFRISRLDQVFRIFATRAEAEAGL